MSQVAVFQRNNASALPARFGKSAYKWYAWPWTSPLHNRGNEIEQGLVCRHKRGMPQSYQVLSVPIHHVTLETARQELITSADERKKGYVIFRDIHGVVRCQDEPTFLKIHQQAMLVCPDGMPLVWHGKRKKSFPTERVYGPDLMRELMRATQNGSLTHFLYGGKPGVADKLKLRLEEQFPGVQITATYTPPFGPLDKTERKALQAKLEKCKPDFFWVGLSTPKQEIFMHEYLTLLDTTIMLGVGAAFDYLSGEVKEPPMWIRKSGLQWLVRVFQEPRRLAVRYLKTVPRFVYLLVLETLKPAN